MLSVVLIWIYIFLTVFPLGYICLNKLLSNDEKETSALITEDYLMFGLMIVTVYAQYFSLFGKVGLLANVLLVLCSILVYVVLGVRRHTNIASLRKSINLPRLIAVLVCIAVFSFGTSRGYMHVDSNLYHAQSIRWIEEFGVVKGLGNLHSRLAYNSSAFALNALYSFSFLGGQSFHACSGFLALITFINCLRFLRVFREKTIRISDIARIGMLYYILNIFDEMVSPESDYYILLFFMYITVRLLDFSERKDVSADLIAFPALLSVFLITIKLSSVGMLTVLLLPVVMLIKSKRIKKLLVYAFVSIVIVLPFLIRNYYLSGWILYPSTIIDIFNPVWKIPQEAAKIDAEYIVAYGKSYTTLEAAKYPFTIWFPHWIESLNKTDLLLFALSVISIPAFFAGLFIRKKQPIIHLTEAAVIISFLLWFLSSPLIRYGHGFLIMVPAVIAGDYVCLILEKLHKKILIIPILCLIVLFLCYKTINLGMYISTVYKQPYALLQQDYDTYETREYNLNGIVFYYPTEDALVGYSAFPSAPIEPANIEMLGDNLSDGFKAK